MAHYAILDENNIVINVIVGKDENEDGVNWEEFYGAKRTSYNTIGNVHYSNGVPSSDQSKAFRKNYASIGGTYDPVRDAFLYPKPFNSWILNEETCLWEPPIPKPQETNNKTFVWDEATLNWVSY